jgi:hypothetical protein
VKSFLSIAFLLLFCCQQYGKVFAYLHCKVYSYYANNADCGCEDSLADNSDKDGTAPLNVNKEKIEEPFIPVAPQLSVAATPTDNRRHYAPYGTALPTQQVSDIPHPPQES